ncbi:uncharacterized protein LOC105439787 [Strongylocentrotus purpuratus]|uniref:Uncharacterized protein n=1 Tax=Strongylocentrotus purpuratus TaxID=7668 RepID=A0A7M7LVV4_STRPU|nr:uncharacterized protein LOC105439787 [Strongylocentrotus purpuratus]
MLYFIGILLNLIAVLNLTLGSDTCQQVKHCKIVHVDKNVEYIFDFLVDQNSQNCTFALKFNGQIFNFNGTYRYTEQFSEVKVSRTDITTKTIFDHLIVNLEIRSVHVDDAGRYKAEFQCSNSTSTTSQSYILRVYYPPEAASCRWYNPGELNLTAHANYGHLPALKCSATNGYPESNIICYSRHQGATIAHNPRFITGDDVKTFIFWLSRRSLRCCSVSELYRKSYHWCKDFVSPDPDRQHSTSQTVLLTHTLSEREATVSTEKPERITEVLPKLHITSAVQQIYVATRIFLSIEIIFAMLVFCMLMVRCEDFS